MPNHVNTPATQTRENFPRRSKRTRPLAVFGSHGSGKTCYFATLFGHSSDGTLSVLAGDPETEDYLSRRWKEYVARESGFPGATEVNMPSYLLFNCGRENPRAAWSAEMLDHAGELVEAGGRVEDEDLRRIVQSWLRESEGVMVFLDAGTTDAVTGITRRNEVGRLLNILREESESLQVTKPLALVLTKWDEHRAFGDPAKAARLLAEWDGEQASAESNPELRRLLSYLRTLPGFQQIRDTLRNFGQRCKVFLVSAVGTNRKPNHHPTDPFGLYAPLTWLLEQSDEGRFATAEQRAKKQTPTQAAATFLDLIREDGIEGGPVKERITERVKALTATAQRRRRMKFGLGVGIAAAVLVACWLTWVGQAGRQYDAWVKYCASPEGAGDARAERRVALGQDLLDWHSFTLNRDQVTHLRAVVLRDQEVLRDLNETAAWGEINAHNENAGRLDERARLSHLQELESKLVAFGDKWGGHKVGAEWRARLVEVRTGIASATGQVTAFDDACAKEKQLEETNPRDYPGLVRLWTNYLNTNPAAALRDQAKDRLQAHKDSHDNDRVNRAKAASNKDRHAVEFCEEFLQEVQKIERELHDPKKHNDTLSNIRDTVLAQADRLLYNEASQALKDAKSSLKVDHILAARTKVGRYLNPPSVSIAGGGKRPVVMRTDASSAMRWLDSFESGRDYPMTPDSLVVPKGHLLFNDTILAGGAEASYGYSLTLTGTMSFDPKGDANKEKQYKTPKKDTKSEDEGKKITVDLASLKGALPMNFKPGQSKDLKITVWREGTFRWWDAPQVTIAADRFIPAVLAQGIPILDKDKKEATLKIKFDGAEIPSLPDYQSRR